jgi:hypothetical protein
MFLFLFFLPLRQSACSLFLSIFTFSIQCSSVSCVFLRLSLFRLLAHERVKWCHLFVNENVATREIISQPGLELDYRSELVYTRFFSLD